MTKEKDSTEGLVRNFIVQETVLRIIGIWPVTGNICASRSRWVFSMMTQISTIYSLSLEVYRHCLDVDDTMNAFIMDLSSVVSLSKLLILRFNSNHLYALINSVSKDWLDVDDSRHRRIMAGYHRRGRIVSLMILYMGYTSGLSFIVKGLPLDLLLPFEMSANSANSSMTANNPLKLNYFMATYCVFGSLPLFHHICVLVMQTMHIFVNAVAHCANDGLFFSLTMHLCGQFEILKMNLTEIEFEKLTYHEEIALFVKRHCRLAVLVNELEKSFSMVILVQLLMSALLICVDGFMFLVCLNSGDSIGMLKCIVVIVNLLAQLFLYSYAGDTLQSQTEDVAQAAYNSFWYRSSGHHVKDLVLIINHGNLPYQVTAGKFVTMNMFTFKEILKASASYLSVLKVMIDT